MYGFISTVARELLHLQARPRRSKRLRLSRRFRQRIYYRDGGKCVFCDNNVKFADATMDHVTPLVKLGKSRTKENVVLSCKSCNQKKGPLELEALDDLSPYALQDKFYRITESLKKRKGRYCEWVTTHYDTVTAAVI